VHIAGRPVPDNWASRVATLVWTACGGQPPAWALRAEPERCLADPPTGNADVRPCAAWRPMPRSAAPA